MEDFRSKPYGDGSRQIQPYGVSTAGVSSMQDLRCYSASYASSAYQTQAQAHAQLGNNDLKLKKAKSTNGSVLRSLSLNDPELQRKKRVAGYKVYAVEGKVKGSFKKSFRWIKDRYSRLVYGFR
ncbi:uncharacterized protein [Euphorbia lathyris]|uniref:uncharacterized protein n=1 Tax=Euphorbia lathyris TaxID=212925 RepID=UPI0033136B6B